MVLYERQHILFAAVATFLVSWVATSGVQAEVEEQRGAVTVTSMPSGVPTLRVGTGPGCTYNTISEAISDAPASGAVIRVNLGTYNEFVGIVNKNITLIGGHGNCSDTSPNDISTVNRGGAGPAVGFIATSGSYTMQIVNFDLVNGDGIVLPFPPVPLPAGGLTVFSSDGSSVNAVVENSWITNNTTDMIGGAGLAVVGEGANFVFLGQGSRIFSNHATSTTARGGGIYCGGASHSLTMAGGRISQNFTGTPAGSNGRGGGAFIETGCKFDFYAHGSTMLSQNLSGGGGGLYVGEGGQATLAGRTFQLPPDEPVSTHPLRVEGNGATLSGTDGRGAGIWVNGGVAILSAAWVLNNDNEQGNGGGIAVTGGGEVILNRNVGSGNCHTALECSLVRNNRAGDTGGAIYVQGVGSNAIITDSVIRNNSAQAVASTEVFLSQNGRARLASTLIYRDDGPSGPVGDPLAPPNYVFWLSADSRLDMLYSTVARTGVNNAIFRMGSTSADLFLRGSVVHDPAVNMHLTSGTPYVDSDCVLWHNDSLTGLGGGGFHTRNTVGNPGFIAPDSYNFQLQAGALTRDYCDSNTQGFGPPPTFDIRGQARGTSSGGTVLHGMFDLGAFEMGTDAIFSDRFELNPF